MKKRADSTALFSTKNNLTRQRGLSVRLRRQTQVRRDGLIAFGEAFLDFVFVLDRRHDDHVIPVLPIGRRCDFVVIGQLQRVDDPQDFMEITPGAGWVGDGQANFFVRIDHEQRTHRQGVAGIGVDQVVQDRKSVV